MLELNNLIKNIKTHYCNAEIPGLVPKNSAGSGPIDP
jgi:hypothetical protein